MLCMFTYRTSCGRRLWAVPGTSTAATSRAGLQQRSLLTAGKNDMSTERCTRNATKRPKRRCERFVSREIKKTEIKINDTRRENET